MQPVPMPDDSTFADERPRSAAPPGLPSARVGRYEVLGSIGQGAMSCVYEATDEDSGKLVAIKVLDARKNEDADAGARFEREVAALERVRHPNVSRLIAWGYLPDSRAYIVCERVEGHTLKEWIEQGRNVEPLAAIEWMIQAAEALAEAWKHHIIHRDLKPGNMMIDETGRLKLLDFGLAKMLFHDVNITADRAMLGTPRYMSPEVGLGRSLDFRSDMYSLGATFYHLILGRSPFDALSPVQMMMMHANAPLTAPNAVDPSLPRDLNAILMRLLAKEPERRYACYADLIADLREARLALVVQAASSAALDEMGKLIGTNEVLPASAGGTLVGHPQPRTSWVWAVLIGALLGTACLLVSARQAANRPIKGEKLSILREAARWPLFGGGRARE